LENDGHLIILNYKPDTGEEVCFLQGSRFLALIDKLSRNVGKKLPLLAA